MKLKLYEINSDYISYLRLYEPYLFYGNKAPNHNSRKYIGMVLEINDFQYFAPLSSFKEKNCQYRALLISEYRVIQSQQKRIIKNAEIVYKNKIQNENNKSLSKRCNDFKVLEKACQMYI